MFIRTVKVGGTSVELALSRHCGPRDIITPIHRRDELLREPCAARPQNFSSDPNLEAEYAAAIDRILRYEGLASELASIAGKIGRDISTSLPRAKVARGRQNRPASSFLTADQKRLITERYADAFEALGYTRED
jgi:hypothetical protein